MKYRLDNVESLLEIIHESAEALNETSDIVDSAYREWIQHRTRTHNILSSVHVIPSAADRKDIISLDEAENYDHPQALAIIGMQRALSYVDKVARGPQTIDVATVSQIHYLVARRNTHFRGGMFRKDIRRITKSHDPSITTSSLASLETIPTSMSQFNQWLLSGYDQRPALVAAALAHLELVSIHPYHDGNGRTARALARLIMRRGGFTFNDFASFEESIEQHRTQYGAAIYASKGSNYSPGYNATPFVKFFLNSIIESIQKTTAKISEFNYAISSVKEDLSQGKIPEVE